MRNELSGFSGLIQLIQTLRSEGGCPWDREQTPRSLSLYLAEEVYELAEAIASGKADDVCEELGDVLFHIFFIAHLFQEKNQFNIHTVAKKITAKMTRRHPHVFGGEKVDNTTDVRKRWYQIKQQEKTATGPVSVLDSVPPTLPALIRAYRISERAAQCGFDWDDISEVMEKVKEEWGELNAELFVDEVSEAQKVRCAEEFGDVLFTLVNVARFSSFHPENALFDATRKFERRFRLMEQLLFKRGKTLETIPRHEKEAFWEQAKAEIRLGDSHK